MINILRKTSVLFFLFLFFTGSPAFAAEELSPVQELENIIGILISQAENLNKSLSQLKSLSEEQLAISEDHQDNLGAMVSYYESLKIEEDGSNVKELAAEIKENRQEIFANQLKKASEFLLVFQTKNALKTAEYRLARISSDIDRLAELEILSKSKPQFLLNEAQLSLVTANGFIEKAEFWVSTTTENEEINIRDLTGRAVARIRTAYKKFFDVSNLIKEALK